ncbi:MAG TPA: hypothetical protein VKW77_02960, partial [Acidimicrobiales bacterium]|nr:hypothetical protein [Acidimicrobiales bacterium]
MSVEGLPPAQEVVEAALAEAAPGSDGCVVIVEESSEVDVRFANNTTTTNGDRRDRRVTVVCFREAGGAVSAGMARRSGLVDFEELAAAAQADAAGSPPAEDAAPLLGPDDVGDALEASVRRYESGPEETDLSVLSPVLRDLAGAFDRARAAGRVLYGFAEHRRATDYLGTSTGLRLAHGQPTGALHLVARSPDGRASSWAGAGTAGFDDVSVEQLERRVVERLGWSAERRDWSPGRTEV